MNAHLLRPQYPLLQDMRMFHTAYEEKLFQIIIDGLIKITTSTFFVH